MPHELRRGDIVWAHLPGYRRPVVVIQSDVFNTSRIGTVLVAAITSNLALARAPGNVMLDASLNFLEKPSVVNISQLATLDRRIIGDWVGSLPDEIMRRIDLGLRLAVSI